MVYGHEVNRRNTQMSIAETIRFDHGVYAEIVHDEDCSEPNDGDSAVKIVILSRNYSNPSPECGDEPDEVAAWAKANAKEWYCANLYMYQHSGVALRAGLNNPFGCPWDSGQVGIIALKKSEFGRGKGELNSKRLAWAQSTAEEYGRWMNGECYGYRLMNEEDEELDSCWGYVGFEFAEEEAKEAAKYYVKQEEERQQTEEVECALLEYSENNEGLGI
jgi:hypothetical protein